MPAMDLVPVGDVSRCDSVSTVSPLPGVISRRAEEGFGVREHRTGAPARGKCE
jgi:hypothetical protein